MSVLNRNVLWRTNLRLAKVRSTLVSASLACCNVWFGYAWTLKFKLLIVVKVFNWLSYSAS